MKGVGSEWIGWLAGFQILFIYLLFVFVEHLSSRPTVAAIPWRRALNWSMTNIACFSLMGYCRQQVARLIDRQTRWLWLLEINQRVFALTIFWSQSESTTNCAADEQILTKYVSPRSTSAKKVWVSFDLILSHKGLYKKFQKKNFKLGSVFYLFKI